MGTGRIGEACDRSRSVEKGGVGERLEYIVSMFLSRRFVHVVPAKALDLFSMAFVLSINHENHVLALHYDVRQEGPLGAACCGLPIEWNPSLFTPSHADSRSGARSNMGGDRLNPCL